MKQTLTIHKFPIGKDYWRYAVMELKNIRSLVIAALLCAIAIIMEKFQIPVIPGVLEVAFSFIVISLCSFLTGPILAIPCGIIVDIVGALINGYSFFFGYTLSAVLGALIYALFLYRAPLSFGRIAMARLTVNLFVNVIVGSIWRTMMFGLPYVYYLLIAGVKNLLLLPLEVFIMAFFIRAMLPSLKRLKFCGTSQSISISPQKIIALACLAILGLGLLILYSFYKTEVNGAIKEFVFYITDKIKELI